MTAPPDFWRSVRIRQPAPAHEVQVPAPPTPQQEDSSVWMMLLPAALSAAVLAIVGLLSNMGNMLLFSLPMTMVAALSSVTVYLYRKRMRERREAEQRRSYVDRLHQLDQHLDEACDAQRSAWLSQNPSLSDLCVWVRERTRDLWARRPSDDDFLSVRLGLGVRSSLVEVKLPDQGLAVSDLWDQARLLARDHAMIKDVPICVPLREAGLTGIAGPVVERLGALRALLLRIAICHAPTEVKIALIVAEADLVNWSWARWLPHLWSEGQQRRYLAAGARDAHVLLQELIDILARRQARAKAETAATLPAIVLMIADDEVIRNDVALPRLSSEGPANGIYVVFVGERVAELPNAIRCGVRFGRDASERPFLSDFEAQSSAEFEPDIISLAAAESLARCMAGIRLIEPAGEQALPQLVTLLDLFEAHSLEDLHIAGRWQQNQRASRSLAIPIGMSQGNEKLVFDLHERVHGPNGLVAGMVGTGKSELLQTLVAGLAINYSPERVAFVLIDYKGGGMADPFAGMAHSAGVITNLQDPGLARRAITSLNIEARYRQEAFRKAGVTHIDEYQRLYFAGQVSEPLPYLVLIVDEFAEMKADQPETAAEFVRLARIGRSLGFRIILAMQKPAGIVDAQIEGNTRFRLCLRVAQPEDSQSMLRRTDAAFLQGVGRAFFQVGVNEVFCEFQVGYSGALYEPERPARDPERVDLVHLGGQREALHIGQTAPPSGHQTQLQAVVDAVNATAVAVGIKQARQLWVEPLPTEVHVEDWATDWSWTGEGWTDRSVPLRVLVGTLDVPEHQTREPLYVDLEAQPHLALVGAPGSGKTSFLRAMLHALVRDYPPDKLAIYAFAFGGGALRAFERFPQVGAIVTGDQTERITRLIRWVRQELRTRQALLAQQGAVTIADYVRATGSPLPEVVLIVDGYTTFATEWEDDAEILVNVAREGGGVGLHLVLTANSASAIPFRIRSNIPNVLALSLADESEYRALVGRVEGLTPGQIPGRGLAPGKPPHLFQTAWYGDGDAAGTELDRLCTEMNVAWRGWRPEPVETLPEVVRWREVINRTQRQGLPAGALKAVPLGLCRDDLAPYCINLEDTTGFGVLGAPRSGKTNVLAELCLWLASRCTPDELALYVGDSPWQELAWVQHMPQTRAYASTAEDIIAITRSLNELLTKRRESMLANIVGSGGREETVRESAFQHHVLVVDGLFEDASSVLHDSIADLLRVGRPLGVHVVFACDGEAISRAYSDPVAIALKALQHGLVLGTTEITLLRLRLPSWAYEQPLAVGEAYHVYRGSTLHVQLALAEPSDWASLNAVSPHGGEANV
ncbi:MAG: type VII secretion protein EssC [Anaerolineales bacterium]